MNTLFKIFFIKVQQNNAFKIMVYTIKFPIRPLVDSRTPLVFPHKSGCEMFWTPLISYSAFRHIL